MKIFFASLVAIATSFHLVAMDRPSQQKKVWVQTTDKNILVANPTVVKASNLLTVLKQHKNNGRYENPIQLPINAEDFHLFRVMHMVTADTLRKTIANDSYFQLINAAEKLKALKTYVNLIREILPKEDETEKSGSIFSAHITHKWIPNLILSDTIRQQCTGYSWTTGDSVNRSTPKIYFNNDGKLFAHDVAFDFGSDITLCNTETHTQDYQFSSGSRHPIFFSPNGNYIISKETFGLFLYNILTKKKHQLLDRDNSFVTVSISDDSRYIINEGRHHIMQSTPVYTLWKLDESNIPQPIALKNDLRHSHAVLFHPDNEHIIRTNDDLYLYDIATHEDKKLTDNPETISLEHRLTFCPGKTHMLCDAFVQNCEHGHWKALLKVKDYTNITPVLLPLQSFHQISRDKIQYIAPQHIPHKNLVTHITDKGKTLLLLDENATLVASHSTKDDTYISAIAADPHGNYLATGYSDGTITIWDLSDTHHIRGKELTGSHGAVTKLTFTDNQLLLSQSQYGEFWETDNPTATPGTAILWDVHGNQILNFGNAVVNSQISQNGKKIVVIDAGLHWNDQCVMHNWRTYLTVTSYNIDVKPKACTLKQALELFEKNEDGIAPKYCFPEYPIHVPKKSSPQAEAKQEPKSRDVFDMHTLLNQIRAHVAANPDLYAKIEGLEQSLQFMEQEAELKK